MGEDFRVRRGRPGCAKVPRRAFAPGIGAGGDPRVTQAPQQEQEQQKQSRPPGKHVGPGPALSLASPVTPEQGCSLSFLIQMVTSRVPTPRTVIKATNESPPHTGRRLIRKKENKFLLISITLGSHWAGD